MCASQYFSHAQEHLGILNIIGKPFIVNIFQHRTDFNGVRVADLQNFIQVFVFYLLYGQQHVILGGKVIKEGAIGNVGSFGNFTDGGLVISLLLNQNLCGTDDGVFLV